MSEKNYLTIEEFLSLPSVSNPTISDDGKKIAYVRKITNWDENQYIRQIWVYDVLAKTAKPLTSGTVESWAPAWSPDSKQLAYLSHIGEKDDQKVQIFINSERYPGGTQVTHAESGVDSFQWALDGDSFFYLVTPEAKEMDQRKERYGEFQYINQEYQRNVLYSLSIEDGVKETRHAYQIPKDLREDIKDSEEKKEIATQLTDGKAFHIYQFAIHPEGNQIVFNGAPTPNQEDTEKLELYLLDLESKKLQTLKTEKPIAWYVLFSPDGSKLCYTRYIDGEVWRNNMTLEIMDLTTGECNQPARQIDENVFPKRWINDGILIEWQEGTNGYLGLITEDGQITPLIKEKGSLALSPMITEDGEHVTYIKANAQQTFEVYLDQQPITMVNSSYTGKWISQKKLIQWESDDGIEIEGILSLPVDYDETKKYPLLVVVHGGPTATSFAIPTRTKVYPIEQFIEKGFIVLEPNYRGSSGYGADFRKLNYRNMGVGDYADVISGVDALIEREMADPERVGVMGWSQGGYISAFCATYSDRFKAISVGAGISNWVTYYVATDIHQFTRLYLGATPWEDMAVYQKTSPMTHIQKACTPTLIQHGDADHRVPVQNAYELYQGLRDHGVETELIIYKGMQHGPTEPGLARAICKQNLIWFCHHILGESKDEFYLHEKEE